MSLEEVLQRSKIKCVVWRKQYFIDEDGSWSLFSVSLPSFHTGLRSLSERSVQASKTNGFYGHSLDLCTSFLIIVLYPDNLQQATKPVCQRYNVGLPHAETFLLVPLFGVKPTQPGLSTPLVKVRDVAKVQSDALRMGSSNPCFHSKNPRIQ